jgi:hypothetical protein
MLHVKNNIDIGRALVGLFATSAAFAKSAQSASSKGKVSNPVSAPNAVMAYDSAEAIKLRSGSGNPVLGKDKSQQCQGYHCEDSNSPDPMIPNLAGQYGKYSRYNQSKRQLRCLSLGLTGFPCKTTDSTWEINISLEN